MQGNSLCEKRKHGNVSKVVTSSKTENQNYIWATCDLPSSSRTRKTAQLLKQEVEITTAIVTVYVQQQFGLVRLYCKYISMFNNPFILLLLIFLNS